MSHVTKCTWILSMTCTSNWCIVLVALEFFRWSLQHSTTFRLVYSSFPFQFKWFNNQHVTHLMSDAIWAWSVQDKHISNIHTTKLSTVQYYRRDFGIDFGLKHQTHYSTQITHPFTFIYFLLRWFHLETKTNCLFFQTLNQVHDELHSDGLH